MASSPAAAAKALNTRLEGSLAASDDTDADIDNLHDGNPEDLTSLDLEPAAQLQIQAGAQRLEALIADAQRLSGAGGDPKLAALVTHIASLLKDGFAPVVFCRYVATAQYVAAELKKHFPVAMIEAVTGELAPEERHERVDRMGDDVSGNGRSSA